MATPGKMAIHGADEAYSSAPPCSIRPQAGTGSCTPRPRYDRDASAKTAWPTNAVTMMRNGAITLGTMWQRIIRAWPNPRARAASTYGVSLIARADERTTRAQRG